MNLQALKTIRKANKITLKELSERTKISRQALSNIENGKGNPTIGSLEAIAQVLGVQIGIVYL